jgi:hypothetical protein
MFCIICIRFKDFHGIYRYDSGYELMGVRSGQAFSIALGYEYDDIDIEILLAEIENYIL